MLRASSYTTNVLPYGLLTQLFSNPVKESVQKANQISMLIQNEASGLGGSLLTPFLQSIERRPPIVTIYRFGDGAGSANVLSFVSPYAPLFDVAV